jgi:hypothetical protein
MHKTKQPRDSSAKILHLRNQETQTGSNIDNYNYFVHSNSECAHFPLKIYIYKIMKNSGSFTINKLALQNHPLESSFLTNQKKGRTNSDSDLFQAFRRVTFNHLIREYQQYLRQHIGNVVLPRISISNNYTNMLDQWLQPRPFKTTQLLQFNYALWLPHLPAFLAEFRHPRIRNHSPALLPTPVSYSMPDIRNDFKVQRSKQIK